MPLWTAFLITGILLILDLLLGIAVGKFIYLSRKRGERF
jgi:hypothetical protein